LIGLPDIEEAHRALKGKVLQTPLVYSPYFSKETGGEVYLKLENLQRTGSFKLRGASYKIHRSLSRIGPRGVVAASAGNHAQGVAYAAQQANIASTIVMPEWASITKQEATRAYGGQVLLQGRNLSASIRAAMELVETGMFLIHPFDDPEIVAGQGTIALEIFSELADPDFILVPVGGGGLVGGIATAVKALRPKTKVIGVQAANCPSAYTSRQQGKIVKVEPERTIADGIAVKAVGETTFPIIQNKVDDIVLVAEEDIGYAVLRLLEKKKILAEGAGAVPIGALFDPALSIPKGARVVLVISGGNVDTPLLDRILRKGLTKNGRIMRFSVTLDDVPGALADLLALIARLQASALHIAHHRGEVGLPISMSRVELDLETRGWEHIDKIQIGLREAGYRID
jgi:threonine dehydratase